MDAMLCELCQCEASTSFHHFIPRTVHSNKWFKKRFTRTDMQSGISLCKGCHDTLHRLIDEKELGRHYNTKAKLQAHPELAKYLTWKRRKHRVDGG